MYDLGAFPCLHACPSPWAGASPILGKGGDKLQRLKSAVYEANGKEMPQASAKPQGLLMSAPAMRAAPATDAPMPDNSAEAMPEKKKAKYRGTLFQGGSYQASGNSLLG